MSAGKGATGRFGTFGGVFTPCTLTILGVIMFLRFGQVVGMAGVAGAVAIVLLSKAITTLTAFSVSAIATNTRVRGGGAYFLISRSLGPEFGGSIGLIFFLAQAISVAMYIFGFTEAFQAAVPNLGIPSVVIATSVNVAVFICVAIGAGWTIKLQYVILGVLVLALVSFFSGAGSRLDLGQLKENALGAYPEGQSFFTAFALFFPAATGIMAGANMSGDLKDPSRSIPSGTLSAIAFTGAVYLGMAVLLGGATDRETLLTDSWVVGNLSVAPIWITLGVFAATLSSALGSMMGAPRILQALARDRVYRLLSPFSQGSGPAKEPRRAALLTFGVAQLGILLGDLNAIAPIITMFFMITYGYLNLATFYEAVTRNPSYRPSFRWSHWTTALLGALGCVVVMFLIEPLWAIISIVAMGFLHWMLARKELEATYGDVGRGIAFERTRRNLLSLEEERYHPKNWRPSILVLSGAAGIRPRLGVYGHWLTGGRGLLTLAQVIPGDVDDHLGRRAGQEQVLRRYIREQELPAFPVVLVAPTIDEGIESLVQCYGIGALRPNLVLTGWSSDPARQADFGSRLRTIGALGRSIVIARLSGEEDEDPWLPPDGPIDVWWRGRGNGSLMLLLAFLLSQNDLWRGRRIRLIRSLPTLDGVEEARQHLAETADAARIRVEPLVLVAEQSLASVELSRVSAQAAIVIMGFEPPEPGQEAERLGRLDELVRELPNVIAVWSAGQVELEA